MKILFVTVDWMKYYVGEGDEEKVVPACGYNYQYMDGYYYGYADGMDALPLEQFEDVSVDANQVDDVLVVWLAANKDGDKCIVGWYKHATVYRNTVNKLTLDSERLEMKYNIVVAAKDALLLPVEERKYAVNHIVDTVHIEAAGLVGSQVMSYIHQYGGDHMNLVLTQEDLERTLTISLNYEQYFYKADEFLARDSYAKAIKCFNKAIQEEPEETLGYECKGSILLSLKMYDEALACYKAVVERDAENELANYCIGLLHGLKGDYQQALAYYEDFIAKRPYDINAVAEKAVVLYALGQQEAASECIAEALKKEQDNQMFHNISNLVNSRN